MSRDEAAVTLAPGRQAWIQMARGTALVSGARLGAGDGAAVSGESAVVLHADGVAEALVFDLA